ncbi:hypothetical protein B0T26DRAFT_790522 [Lasiosphaeria miniovina]|uniref:Heterokaryon incompatibility domain-containing protein n=1 Tax=Lasiosphaeria miniovina TaxID=1954250 RepID=A0AA40DP41_9PEZI|nr:uncharacterized protein B0T26DRAFT_790522 [Lasiosphaeria miniovina]KAK0706968.1 hypothetical protein B0T26DRAFT_790522 [Lasiosphaeria miniovina]
MNDRLKRPYFFRAWIIQEIAAAKVAIVTQGASSHVWPIYDKDTATDTFLPWIKHFESRAYKTSDDLWQLVIDSWTSQARDPRDKVFALLGVISGAAADSLLAEYFLSMEQVYTGFADFAISRHGVAEVLKYAGGYRKSESLPSWVPDWQLLSRDWDIMSQIKSFHSSVTQISIASKFMISRPRTELVSQPWELVNPDQVPLARVTIQGGLCLHGVKITELSEGYSRNQSVDGFAVWEGPLFITGPPTALETDSVFLLHGLDTAATLRRQLAGRDDIFQFVGMCFVRAQTGVVIYEKAWKHHPFWTRDFAEQSILRIRSQIGRESFHEENAEMHAALKNLQGTKLEEYAEWEYRCFRPSDARQRTYGPILSGRIGPSSCSHLHTSDPISWRP